MQDWTDTSSERKRKQERCLQSFWLSESMSMGVIKPESAHSLLLIEIWGSVCQTTDDSQPMNQPFKKHKRKKKKPTIILSNSQTIHQLHLFTPTINLIEFRKHMKLSSKEASSLGNMSPRLSLQVLYNWNEWFSTAGHITLCSHLTRQENKQVPQKPALLRKTGSLDYWSWMITQTTKPHCAHRWFMVLASGDCPGKTSQQKLKASLLKLMQK